MMQRRTIAAGLLPALLLTLSVSLWGCGGGGGQPQMQAMPLPAEKLATGTLAVSRSYPAAIEGVVDVEVRPQVEGTLSAIHVDEGDYVKAGAPLFSIDERVYRQHYNAALAALETARIEAERLEPLVASKVISEVQLKTARARLQSARAAAELARVNLGFTRITAPVSGYVGTIPFRQGSLVTANQPERLTLLSDVSAVYAYFSMGEADYLRLRSTLQGEGQPVSLLLADGSTFPHPGRIDAVSGQFDAATASISLRARFDNPEALLRSGNTGRVVMQEEFRNVMIVPEAATFELQDKVFLYLVDDEGKARRTAVAVKARSNGRLVVEGPLQPGGVILTGGFARLQDGMPVTPTFEGDAPAQPQQEPTR